MGSKAREFPRSDFLEGESASPSPFQPSLRLVPPLLGLRPATKGAIPLGTPLFCSANQGNSLISSARSRLRRSLPARLRMTFSPMPLALGKEEMHLFFSEGEGLLATNPLEGGTGNLLSRGEGYWSGSPSTTERAWFLDRRERRAKEEFGASFLAGEASGLTNHIPRAW